MRTHESNLHLNVNAKSLNGDGGGRVMVLLGH